MRGSHVHEYDVLMNHWRPYTALLCVVKRRRAQSYGLDSVALEQLSAFNAPANARNGFQLGGHIGARGHSRLVLGETVRRHEVACKS